MEALIVMTIIGQTNARVLIKHKNYSSKKIGTIAARL